MARLPRKVERLLKHPRTLREIVGDFAPAIGMLIYLHQWLDQDLRSLIHYIVGGDSSNIQTILSHIPNFETKVDLFSQLCHIRFYEKKRVLERVKNLVDELDYVNGQRNNIIHGRWVGISYPKPLA